MTTKAKPKKMTKKQAQYASDCFRAYVQSKAQTDNLWLQWMIAAGWTHYRGWEILMPGTAPISLALAK